MRKSFFTMVVLALVAMCFSVCSSVNSCDSSETKNALAQSIKQMVGNEARINYDSFKKLPIDPSMYYEKVTTQDIAISKGLNQNTTFTCSADITISLNNEVIFRDFIEYAPQYDYDNKMYVTITDKEISRNRFVNLEFSVATTRLDLASTLKAIVTKVFVDNIDTKQPKAPNPDNPSEMIEWGEWIIKIADLNPKKYKAIGNGIYPIDRISGALCECMDNKFNTLPLMWIDTKTSRLHFNPSKISKYANQFCAMLKGSYRENNSTQGLFLDGKDKVIPLSKDDASFFIF
ncbi:hypothetical protein [Helicobacter sp. 23-1045]